MKSRLSRTDCEFAVTFFDADDDFLKCHIMQAKCLASVIFVVFIVSC